MYMSGSKAMLLSFKHKVTPALTGVRSLFHYTKNFITHTRQFETTGCETAVLYLFQQMFKYSVCLLILLVLVNCFEELESVYSNEFSPTNWTG
jgi:hypothetical protein